MIYETYTADKKLLSTYSLFDSAHKEWMSNMQTFYIKVVGNGKVTWLSNTKEVDNFILEQAHVNENAYLDKLKANSDATSPDGDTALAELYWISQMSRPKSSNLVDTNLKTAAAQNKPRLSDVPPVALFALGAAMSDGKDKYGRYNWRETGSTASVFYDAMQRHLNAWYSGEDYASDSKVHHLAHLMASCAILLDSELHGQLSDDRKKGINPLIDPIWKND